MKYKKAIIAGFISLDIHLDFSSSHPDFDGEIINTKMPHKIDKLSMAPGGVVPGVGLALNNLGITPTLVGKVGDDPFGETVKKLIKEKAPNLADDLIIDPGMATGYQVFLNSAHYFPGVNNTFYASDLRRDVLRAADLFHFGYPALMRSIYRSEGGELVSILQRVRREGLSTSVAFGLPDPERQAGKSDWRNILENTLPLVDIFVTDLFQLLFYLEPDLYQQLSDSNHSDLHAHLKSGLLDQICAWVLDHGVKILIIDMAEGGLYLQTNTPNHWQKSGRGLSDLGEEWYEREMWSPAFSVEVKNDRDLHNTLFAGFLAGILMGFTPEKCQLLAQAARAAIFENACDPADLPHWEDLLSRIDENWELGPLRLEKFGFRKGNNGIWERK